MTAHHVCPTLQPPHRVYTAVWKERTVIVKVQPREYSAYEEHVLKLMADPMCHTVKMCWKYDHTPRGDRPPLGYADASALVLEYAPYAWDQRVGLQPAVPEDVMKRAFQLTEVRDAGAPSL